MSLSILYFYLLNLVNLDEGLSQLQCPCGVRRNLQLTARAPPCLRPSPAQVCWSLECSPLNFLPPGHLTCNTKSLLYSFPGPKTPDYTGGSPVRSAAWGLLWKEDLIRAQEDSLQVVMTLMTTRWQSLPTGEQGRVPGRVRGGLKERVMRPCLRARGHVGAVQSQRPSVRGLHVCTRACAQVCAQVPDPGRVVPVTWTSVFSSVQRGVFPFQQSARVPSSPLGQL